MCTNAIQAASVSQDRGGRCIASHELLGTLANTPPAANLFVVLTYVSGPAMFALTTVTAILGAVAADLIGGWTLEIAGVAAILLGIAGFAGSIAGAIILVLDRRLAARSVRQETDEALARITRGG